jgi:hypothetical protein
MIRDRLTASQGREQRTDVVYPFTSGDEPGGEMGRLPWRILVLCARGWSVARYKPRRCGWCLGTAGRQKNWHDARRAGSAALCFSLGTCCVFCPTSRLPECIYTSYSAEMLSAPQLCRQISFNLQKSYNCRGSSTFIVLSSCRPIWLCHGTSRHNTDRPAPVRLKSRVIIENQQDTCRKN